MDTPSEKHEAVLRELSADPPPREAHLGRCGVGVRNSPRGAALPGSQPGLVGGRVMVIFALGGLAPGSSR
ncbi:hypothetical protein [Saccharopolyspora endophytica]|uniref:Uncharacterized protein n=1 Tax=Saccharopolyspora endophytica TaxID=543886 RepID=A0ABS5DH88_9PSEU|nr:hypothetical protein [Saccharopolyspora endophytica]MBQ0925660.1 hypothetical protein [Saccharopolyspora endophytica]